MASFEALLTEPAVRLAVDEQGANLQSQAIVAAPGADEVYIIEGVTVSASGTPSASVIVTLDTDSGARTLWSARLPNAAFAPIDINFKKALVADKGKNVRLTIPALGVGIIGRVEFRGIVKKAQ